MDLFSIMNYSWLIPVIAGVFVLLTVWKVVGGLLRRQAQDRRLLQTGAQASAQVMSLQPTGASVSYGGHRQPQVALMLTVHPAGGRPYQTQLVTYISEFQIPQIQPGATLQVRYDRANPGLVAIESFGGPAPGAPQGTGASTAAPSTPFPVAMNRPGFPKAAIIGLVIGLIGMAIAIYVVMVNVGGFGLDTDASSGGICGKAAACCEKVTKATPAGAAADTCKNLKKIGVPDQVCQTAYDSFKQSAEGLKISCE